MSRIRSVHPGLFTDEDFMALTAAAPLAAVLVPGLWCEADDQGVFLWKPLTLKARLLPNANADILNLLTILEQRRFYSRFVVDGAEYGAIRNFRRWQRPQKPTATYPLPEELRSYVGLKPLPTTSVADGSGSATGKSPQMEDVGGRRKDVGGEEATKESAPAGASPPAAPGPVPAEPAATDPDPPGDPFELPAGLDRRPAAQRRRPRVPIPDDWMPAFDVGLREGLTEEDCRREAAKLRSWATGDDHRKVDWQQTADNWFRRAADDRRSRAPRQHAAGNGSHAGGVVAAAARVRAALGVVEGARPAEGRHEPARAGDRGLDGGAEPGGDGSGIEILPPRHAAGTR